MVSTPPPVPSSVCFYIGTAVFGLRSAGSSGSALHWEWPWKTKPCMRQIEQHRSTRYLSSKLTARTECLRLGSSTTKGYRRRQKPMSAPEFGWFPPLRSAVRCRRTVSYNPIATPGSPTLTTRIMCKPLPAVIFRLGVTLPRAHPVLWPPSSLIARLPADGPNSSLHLRRMYREL